MNQPTDQCSLLLLNIPTPTPEPQQTELTSAVGEVGNCDPPTENLSLIGKCCLIRRIVGNVFDPYIEWVPATLVSEPNSASNHWIFELEASGKRLAVAGERGDEWKVVSDNFPLVVAAVPRLVGDDENTPSPPTSEKVEDTITELPTVTVIELVADSAAPELTQQVTLAHDFQAGDRVIWEDCPAHCESWNPYTIVRIEGDKAAIDIYSRLVPLTKLGRVS